MSKINRRKFASCMAVCAVAVAGMAAPSLVEAAEAVKLRFATVGIGSSWYAYGAGIADMLKPNLPAGSTIDVLPIAGGVGNMKLLQNEETEIALGFIDAADACAGKGEFDKPHDKIRGLVGGLDIYYFGTFVTAKSGINSWDEIAAGKARLLTASVGGSGEKAARQVLGLYGSSKEDVAKKGGSVKALDRAGTASAIADGQADAWAHVVTKGHPIATQLTTITDMKILSLSDKVIKELVAKYGWSEATIPANMFKGQAEPIKTVKTASNILIRSDISDEVAYTITKTVVENAEKLRQIHAGLADFDPKDAAQAGLVGNCPFHPGAVKYYKEKGMM